MKKERDALGTAKRPLRNPMRRLRILEAIGHQTETIGYPPSMRELAAAVGVQSTATIQKYLRRMRDDGLVTWWAGMPRTLRLTDAGKKERADWGV